MKSPSSALPTGRPTRPQAVSPHAQAAARWNEVFLPRLEIAGSVAFKIGVVSARTILADSIGTGQEIWDEDAGVIAALPPDDLAAGEQRQRVAGRRVPPKQGRSNGTPGPHGRLTSSSRPPTMPLRSGYCNPSVWSLKTVDGRASSRLLPTGGVSCHCEDSIATPMSRSFA